MEKMLFFVFVSLMFISCDQISDMYYQDKYCGHDLYWNDDMEDLSEIYEKYELQYYLESVAEYINERVSYEKNGAEDAKGPRAALKDGKANCAEYAILFLNVVYFTSGEKGSLLLVDTSNRSVSAGGSATHALVRVFGLKLSAQSGTERNDSVAYYYGFSKVFN